MKEPGRNTQPEVSVGTLGEKCPPGLLPFFLVETKQTHTLILYFILWIHFYWRSCSSSSKTLQFSRNLLSIFYRQSTVPDVGTTEWAWLASSWKEWQCNRETSPLYDCMREAALYTSQNWPSGKLNTGGSNTLFRNYYLEHTSMNPNINFSVSYYLSSRRNSYKCFKKS